MVVYSIYIYTVYIIWWWWAAWTKKCQGRFFVPVQPWLECQWSILEIGGGNALVSLRSAVKLEEEEEEEAQVCDSPLGCCHSSWLGCLSAAACFGSTFHPVWLCWPTSESHTSACLLFVLPFAFLGMYSSLSLGSVCMLASIFGYVVVFQYLAK